MTGMRHIEERQEGIHNRRSESTQVPIVPISVKAPEVTSMLYMETLFDPEFVT